MSKFTHHIQPPSGFSLAVKELWQYRELFYFFTWRDIKVKYKQTYLGILWALIQPLGMMLIFTFIFSKTLQIDSGNIVYPVFVLAALVLWNFFNAAVSNAAESMILHAPIIKKIYFPRLIIPGSTLLVAFFDFLIGLVIFFVLCLYYHQAIEWTAIFYFPAGIFVVVFSAFGLGTFLAALNVKFRDFRYTLPFLMQLLFFASQIIYPLTAVKQSWLHYLLAVNPMNAGIELFRSPLYHTSPDMQVVGIGLASALLLFITGLIYFRKTEAYFADIS